MPWIWPEGWQENYDANYLEVMPLGSLVSLAGARIARLELYSTKKVPDDCIGSVMFKYSCLESAKLQNKLCKSPLPMIYNKRKFLLEVRFALVLLFRTKEHKIVHLKPTFLRP